MRSLLVLLTLVAVAFLAVNRNRVYLRDPLANVYRDEVQQAGASVFINYSNDVLFQDDDDQQGDKYLVQGWNRVPGISAELNCLKSLVCLAPADHAPMAPLLGAMSAQMTSRQVAFVDGSKVHVRITLW